MARIIAIGGVSRSGKSTLALWLHQHLPNSMILCQDDFPNAEQNIPRVRDRIDWEHPDSINWQAWKRAVTSNAADCDYLILEGLLIFRPESEVLTPDFRYYLTMEKTPFIEERQKEQRWGKEPLWFIEHVWDSHFVYGTPSGDQNAHVYHQITEADYPSILQQITT